jgi:hypothetical protein
VSALEIEAAEPSTLVIADLKREPELSCRAAGINKATVREYAAAMAAGTVFPPVVVYVDNKNAKWLADGFHRCSAAELAGLTEVAAEVRQGSKKDALLHAAGANAEHGRARSPADKRKAVNALLNDPTWAKRSDNWIAQHAKVSQPFVSKLRTSTTTSNVISGVREAADGREIDTSKIGTKPEANLDRFAGKFRKLLSEVPRTQLQAFADVVLAALANSGEDLASAEQAPMLE